MCALQKLALLENEHKWKYKPLYCILFPLTIYEGSLTIDDEHIDRLKTCNVESDNQDSIFDASREELLHFFGESDFDELEKYRDEYLTEIQVGEKQDVSK